MKLATSKQVGYIKGLGKQHGMEYDSADFKDDQGKITLTYEEANSLIQSLRGGKDQSDLMRKKVISMARTMRWYIPNTHNPDIERIDNWCMKYGQCRKKLNDHSHTELTKLVTQFQKVMKTYLENKAKKD